MARKVSYRQPFRSLVKDLIENDPPMTSNLLKLMREELLRLRSIGVYPMDIYLRNYKGGYLVDFSSAWTMLYFLTRVLPQSQLDLLLSDDIDNFNILSKKTGIQPVIRASPKQEYPGIQQAQRKESQNGGPQGRRLSKKAPKKKEPQKRGRPKKAPKKKEPQKRGRPKKEHREKERPTKRIQSKRPQRT